MSVVRHLAKALVTLLVFQPVTAVCKPQSKVQENSGQQATSGMQFPSADLRRAFDTQLQIATEEVRSDFESYSRVEDYHAGDFHVFRFVWGGCDREIPHDVLNDAWQPEVRPGNDIDSRLSAEALVLAVFLENARRFDYPAEVVDRIAREATDHLISMLAARRSSPSGGPDIIKEYIREHLNARLDAVRSPRPRLQGQDCDGAMPQPTIFRSNPPEGRVWIISQFRFLHCRARYGNPWDRNPCRYWIRAGRDQILRVTGTIVYQIEWGNRATRRDRTRITFEDPDVARVVLVE